MEGDRTSTTQIRSLELRLPSCVAVDVTSCEEAATSYQSTPADVESPDGLGRAGRPCRIALWETVPRQLAGPTAVSEGT